MTKYVTVTLLALSAICFADSFQWGSYERKNDDWFKGTEAKDVAKHVLSWQDEFGSWPKNIDTGATEYPNTAESLHGTFDNAATTGEMRFLARIYNATGEEKYKAAFIKALSLIFEAQYPSGGWPQYYPADSKEYPRHVTFNDGVMVRLMELLRDIISESEYDFIGGKKRAEAKKAFDKGISFILRSQIRVNGELGVWCAQHDEVSYEPCGARSYELPSLSGGESSGILRLLMELDDPSPAVVRAITGGVSWYRKNEVKGVKVSRVNGKFLISEEAGAPVMWARFYDIETGRPFFCDRDGIKKFSLKEVGQERIGGYKWYGDWGKNVYAYYAKWSKKWADRLKNAKAKPIAVIGDSTVCEYPEESVKRGWGHYLQEYFNSDVVVINEARSGRSTSTFVMDGFWDRVLDEKPAFVLIQFGHNDSHNPANREATDAYTNYRDNLRKYIDQCRNIGAVPVLITPMHRRTYFEDGSLDDNLKPYADAMKIVAEEKGAGLVDLHKMSGDLILRLGEEAAMKMANSPSDRTHFNETGARAMLKLIMQELGDAEPKLKKYLKN
jgi:pectate lyase